ncbi:hypothetical protein AB8O64_29955 [Streptomyces sp. QH1-20]|uniref:hypothetical protein n=1 Tax=Streptomyces sp. QH1-20 TaxID=3240934 RepID=UPI0035124E88
MVRNWINFIKDFQPDEIIGIGDTCDFTAPSRWNKDTKGEFENDVFEQAEYTKRKVLKPTREVFDGKFGILRSNHGDRPRDYLRKYAPALSKTEMFDEAKLLDYEGLEINDLGDFYDFTEGWTVTHGHLGFSASRYAGGAAIAAARRIGKSVVMGHVHKLGLINESRGYKGSLQTLTGVEVGHFMDINKATYLKHGATNWQPGFTVLYVGSYGDVTPVLVPMASDGSFTVEGQRYGALKRGANGKFAKKAEN